MRVRNLTQVLVLVPFLSAPLGCARGQSAEERQLAELRDELTKVQAESERVEQRLGKLEVDSTDGRTDGRAPEPGKPTIAGGSGQIVTPPLRTVRLGPDGLEESSPPAETAGSLEGADPSDTTPRPRIRIQGSGAEATITTEKGGKPRKLRNDRLDDAPATDAPSASSPSALDADAKRAYDAALALVNGKKYAQALDAFAGFLVRWPDHPNADNALYWRGECYFAQGDYAHAAEQFDGVVARFPLGNKAPDALLKLGLSKQHLGKADEARASFERLRREFPHSDAARRVPRDAARPTSGENP